LRIIEREEIAIELTKARAQNEPMMVSTTTTNSAKSGQAPTPTLVSHEKGYHYSECQACLVISIDERFQSMFPPLPDNLPPPGERANK
jgi:hypothetical protein